MSGPKACIKCAEVRPQYNFTKTQYKREKRVCNYCNLSGHAEALAAALASPCGVFFERQLTASLDAVRARIGQPGLTAPTLKAVDYDEALRFQ